MTIYEILLNQCLEMINRNQCFCNLNEKKYKQKAHILKEQEWKIKL